MLVTIVFAHCLEGALLTQADVLTQPLGQKQLVLFVRIGKEQVPLLGDRQ